METIKNNTPNEEATEEIGEPAFDCSSNDGARRYNEMLDEGSAYILSGARLTEDYEAYLDDDQREYVDPELRDTDEEVLSPGEMELIFENSFVM
ncbi:MAG: hypothetical protein P4K83_02685 [Terracidiphilus sp.]|nr:hypothetical protein [Terracidiphilus sp.]